MELHDRLEFFQEMMQCRYSLFCWEYERNWDLLRSNCPDEAFLNTLFLRNDNMPSIQDSLADGSTVLLAGSAANVLWGIVTGPEDRYYVIGPVMSTECSMKELSEILRRAHDEGTRVAGREWSLEYQELLTRHLKALPVVPVIEFCKDLAMLCYCVTGKVIHHSDVTWQIFKGTARTSSEANKDRYRTWMAERALLGMVRNGDTDYKYALNHAASVSRGVSVQGEGSLRQAKISGQTFTSLCTRAAISGGLTPEQAYSVGDAYIQRIEDCPTLADIPAITHEMYEDFILRVHRQMRKPDVSPHVQLCMDYIENHMQDRLTIAALAEKVGYSESYLYHRFKKETGIGINDYIKAARIERAKVLLTSTEDSVQEIAIKLGYSGRSYFAKIFQRLVGMGPVEYRRFQKE